VGLFGLLEGFTVVAEPIEPVLFGRQGMDGESGYECQNCE